VADPLDELEQMHSAITPQGDGEYEFREALDAAWPLLLRRLRAAEADAERWRYWRVFWPALCMTVVARFARIDLRRKFVQSPKDMDEVTDAAIDAARGKP